MHRPIEDYALIGDCHGAGLVCRDGSIDWLCVPRFDAPATFSALLGRPEHGRWKIAPKAEVSTTTRRYRDGTLTLETDFETATGSVRIIDVMPIESPQVDLVRCVEGLSGEVAMELELVVRFGSGRIKPWIRSDGRQLEAIAGPDRVRLDAPVRLAKDARRATASFSIHEGQKLPFVLSYGPSHEQLTAPIDATAAIEATDAWWRNWSSSMNREGRYDDAVMRSLITLKALTYKPTGGIVAAPSASLPEALGGTRNWDYRYCWLRDATITLSALFRAGYVEEARAFREWLLRAVAGEPSDIQVLYGIEGRRDVPEIEAPWLPGYANSRPVRLGNDARSQLQLDVHGELMDTMHQCRCAGLENDASWELERSLLEHLEGIWRNPDQGIWEMRSEPRHFVHSKVMCWLAFDRGVRAVRQFGRPGPAERWAALKDEIFTEVCERGYNSAIGAFTQSYDSDRLDASVLMMATTGFLSATDPRIRSTVTAIERSLTRDGLVRRYQTGPGVDGINEEEGCFLTCSFWLVENLALQGKREEARRLFERLLSLRNDVGLLSEEYDPRIQRMLGNFPQALSHLALVNSAYCLADGASLRDAGPARQTGRSNAVEPSRANT